MLRGNILLYIILTFIILLLPVSGNVMLSGGAQAQATPIDERPAEFIPSIQIEGSPAYAGTSITVIIMGVPGGKATFMVSGNDIAITMSEIQDGLYQGRYTVRWEDAIGTHDVIAQLTVAEQKVSCPFDHKPASGVGELRTFGMVVKRTKKVEIETTFQVIRPPLLTSVSVIGSPAKGGDELLIRVTGKTGAKVRADIDQVIYDMPLTEVTEMPGVYEGKRTVMEGENVFGSVVTIHFTYEGETVTDKSQRVTIDTKAPAINEKHVDKSPLQNGSSFTLTVDCEVGALVTVDLSQLDTIRGIVCVPEVAAGIFSKVFTLSYDNLAINGMKTIEITARDTVGNQSTAELLVELRNPKLNAQQLLISGQVIVEDSTLSGNAIRPLRSLVFSQVSIYNATSKQEKISPIAIDGSYTVTFAESKQPVAEIGTSIYLSVMDGSNVIANVSHQLSAAEVIASKATIDIAITAAPKIDITVEPSILPADGYSLAMVTVTVVEADDEELSVSASSGIIAPLVEAGPGIWTTTYTAGKTPGNILFTASILTAPPIVATFEVLLTPALRESESILLHCPQKRVIVGKTAPIRGMIDPPMFAETINLEVYEPGGSSFVEQAMTDRDGQFYFQLNLNRQGTWSFRANHKKTRSSIAKIEVEAELYLNPRDREWKQSLSMPKDINYLLEDTRGVLWAATWYGVMKLEDEEWISYGLDDKYISSLIEDSRGALWAAMKGGVHKLLKDGKWEEYSKGIDSEIVVNALFEDSYGVLWAATNNGVMKLVDNPLTPVAEVAKLLGKGEGERWIPYGLSGRSVNFLLEDIHGVLWAATNDGINWLDGEIWIQYGYELGSKVSFLLEDSHGVLWAATNSGVWKITDEMQKYTTGLVSKTVLYLLEDNHGTLWVGTNEGVYWLNGERWQKYVYGLGPALNEVKGSVSVRCLLEDSHGVLWAATNNGIWQLMGEIWVKYTTNEGLEDDFVNYLLEDSRGTLWAATNEGVSNFDGKTWRPYSEGLESKYVNCLLENNRGMWAATNGGGVSKLEDGIWKPYNEGLESKYVNFLLEDNLGALWAATDEGVSKLEDGIWRTYSEGLKNKYINYLLVDSHGTILAATNEGVSMFVPSSGGAGVGLDGKIWRPYSDGLDSNVVRCLREDSFVNIWAATDGGVLFALYSGTHQLVEALTSTRQTTWKIPEGEVWTTQYTTRDGLGSNDVNYLFFDSRFTLWAATHRGVSRFPLNPPYQRGQGVVGGQGVVLDPNQERWYTDDRLEHNCNHIIEDKHGVLWLATSVGVIRYEPNLRAPQTKIENGPRGVIGQQSTTFKYSGSDIETDRRFLLYSSKLDNDQWSVFSEATSVRISADDGLHTFYVKAMDADGNIDQTPAKCTFRIDTTQPIAIIEKPAVNEVIGGKCLITGTATDLPTAPKAGQAGTTDFLEYELKIHSEEGQWGKEAMGQGGRIGKHQVSAGSLATWDTDGKNGIYTITLTVRDKKESELDTQHTSTTSVTVFVDNTPPTAEILSVTDNSPGDDGLSGVIHIRGQISDEPKAEGVGERSEHIAEYTVECLQNNRVKWEKTEKFLESGMIEIPDFDSSAIYGDAIIRLTAKDFADNESIPAEVSVFIDNEGTKPSVQFTTPKDGDVITGVVEIKGTVKTSGTLESYVVEYSLQGGKGAKGQGGKPPTSDFRLPTSPEESWQRIGQIGTTTVEIGLLATWDTTRDTDGEYLLRLTARDTRGEQYTSSTQPISIIVDNTKPTASITPPDEKWFVRETVDITGKATDVNFKEYKVDYGRGTAPENNPLTPVAEVAKLLGKGDEPTPNPSQEGSRWKPIAISEDERQTEHKDDGVLVSEWNTEGIPDGEYTLKLTVTDKAGLQGTATQFITLDNTGVVTSISAPEESAYVRDAVEIRGTAYDENFNQYRIEIEESGKPDTRKMIAGPIRTPRRNEQLATWETPANVEAEYTIRLTASNLTHPEESKTVTVKVDNQRPTAVINVPQDGAIVSGSVKIEGIALDTYVEDYRVEYALGVNPTATDWELIGIGSEPVSRGVLETWDTRGLNLEDGLYSLRLTVKEGTGLASEAKRLVTLDNHPATAIIFPLSESGIVTGKVDINGTASDDNFDKYEIYVARGVLSTDDIGWGSPIHTGTSEIKQGVLYSWNTNPLEDGEYSIKLIAYDKTTQEQSIRGVGGTPPPSNFVVKVKVDNTKPIAEILSPQQNDQVGDMVTLIGTAMDENFSEYLIEFVVALGLNNAVSSSIDDYRGKEARGQGGKGAREQLPSSPLALLPPPDDWIKVSRTPFSREIENDTLIKWPAEGRTGPFTFRLTVKDKANLMSYAFVTVDIRPAIKDNIGGETKSRDGNARIYVPPNSLSDKQVITINPVPEADVQNTVPADIGYFGIAYDFEPDNLKFKSKPAKPALITISYFFVGLTRTFGISVRKPHQRQRLMVKPTRHSDAPRQPHLPQSGTQKTVKLCRYENGIWTPIGGTVDVKKREISAAVMELGRYAIMETAIDNGGKRLIDNLTCQPRVFGVSVYHSSTAISFELGGRTQVTVKIYNLAGRLKKTLVDNEAMNQGRNVVIYDGTDEDGQKVLSGLYVIVIVTEEDKATTTVAVLNK